MSGLARALSLCLFLVLLLAAPCGGSESIPTPSLRDFYYSEPTAEEQHNRRLHLEALTDLLFPNREAVSDLLAPLGIGASHSSRALVATQPPSDKYPVVCVTCTGMTYCPALNQYRVEERYLPNNLEQKEACVVLDELGARIQGETFGPGRTFRDTTQCRDIVMQYLCLFYGSNNYMYRNWCQFREDVSPANKAEYKVAPRFPCRSFCVQVATVCVNDPLFLQLCGQIACPPLQDDCTPNPTVRDASGKAQDLAAGLGCSMPYSLDPYSPKNSAPRSAASSAATIALVLACSLLNAALALRA